MRNNDCVYLHYGLLRIFRRLPGNYLVSMAIGRAARGSPRDHHFPTPNSLSPD